MKLSFRSLSVALGILSFPTLGMEVTCIDDHRPVNGELVSIHLKTNEKGQGVAVLKQESANPAVSFSEMVTLRAMSCLDKSKSELSIDCSGVNQLQVGESEFADGGGAIKRQVVVTTSYKNRSFSFDNGPIDVGPIKNGCEIEK